MDSAIVLAIVVLGGMGSQAGVVIAAFFLIGAPELIRGLSDYRMLIFGADHGAGDDPAAQRPYRHAPPNGAPMTFIAHRNPHSCALVG